MHVLQLPMPCELMPLHEKQLWYLLRLHNSICRQHFCLGVLQVSMVCAGHPPDLVAVWVLSNTGCHSCGRHV